MFPNPETPQPESKVVQFPFPEKAEAIRDVHLEELDKRFEKFISPYRKMKTLALTKLNFRGLRHQFVVEGGISEEVFEKYLESRGFTWEKWWGENTIDAKS